MKCNSPAEIPDIDFRDLIVAPCVSYEDTLILVEGMDPDDAADEIEWAQLAVGAAYRHFGGKESQTLLPSLVDVEEYVEVYRLDHPYGIAGRETHIARLALRYLNGEGEDYSFMEELASEPNNI